MKKGLLNIDWQNTREYSEEEISYFLLYRKQLAEITVDNILAEIYIEKIR